MARKQKSDKSKKHQRPIQSLETIQPHAAGIDLGSREHWVAGPPQENKTPNVERFCTTTPGFNGSRFASSLNR